MTDTFIDNYFPDSMAQKIAKTVDLYPTESIYRLERNSEKFKKADHQLVLLREFQQMALYCDLDTCMLLYCNESLTEEQADALVKIQKFTRGSVCSFLIVKLIEAGTTECAQLAMKYLDEVKVK